MNKKQLIDTISESSRLSKADAGKVLNALINGLTDVLAKGESITLPGFASFSVKERPARIGRNPKTGESMSIPAGKTICFKPLTKLKESINNQDK